MFPLLFRIPWSFFPRFPELPSGSIFKYLQQTTGQLDVDIQREADVSGPLASAGACRASEDEVIWDILYYIHAVYIII